MSMHTLFDDVNYVVLSSVAKIVFVVVCWVQRIHYSLCFVTRFNHARQCQKVLFVICLILAAFTACCDDISPSLPDYSN
jgi:hypothetical protein